MHSTCNRRRFLRWGTTLAAGAPVAVGCGLEGILRAASASPPKAPAAALATARVAVVRCRTYGAEVKTALRQAFDLLGGVGSLVKAKTVTVKLNLTGTNFMPFLDRPPGETYMTHFDTALALAALVFEAGARRVRFVESTQSRSPLETSLGYADWDLQALQALGAVEFENTRNRGRGKTYARLPVPDGGHMFSAFEVNRAYEDTDVMVSLAKLKQHVTAGLTLTMKNLFGITPNALYGDEAGSEDAVAGRGPLHNPAGLEHIKLPGLKDGVTSRDPTSRVPRIVADLCAARPVHLAIIDGITAMSGGEGWWCGEVNKLRLTTPGVLIAGLNPVSADAVGAAVMGCANPRASRGATPFHFCDNHLLLAEQAGVGVADLARIDLRGLDLDQARWPYPDIKGV